MNAEPDPLDAVINNGLTLRGAAADVLGQMAPGISVWHLCAPDGRTLHYVVVPGNVGGPDAVTDVLDACGLR